MAFFQTKHVWIKQLPDQVGVLMLDREQSAANFLDLAMLDDVERALDAVTTAGDFRLLVIRSTKSGNFCTGPAHGTLANWKTADFCTWSERGQQVCNKLADLKAPSACVIAGTCCDAGLELALACDYRVAVNSSATSLGFPELEWGMVPCWGATQRLPHLVGLENSMHMLLTGQKLDAIEALANGLVDELADEAGDEPPSFLENPIKRNWTDFPRRNWRERWLESNRAGRWFLFRGAERVVRTRIPDEMPAQGEMLQALRIAFEPGGLRPGLAFERQAIERIAGHPALHNLLHLLTHREKLRTPAIGSADKRGLHNIGVLGSGTAGLSLLLHCVVKGHLVVMRAEDEEALGKALSNVIHILQAEVQSGTMTEVQFQKLLRNVRGTYTWTHFDTVDMVLDTTEGTLERKRQFYQEVEAEIPSSAILAPLSATHRAGDLQVGLTNPGRLVGLHVIEPWNRAGIAEIVSPLTPSGTKGDHAKRVREWAVGIGKSCLQVPDRAGGLVMRVWMPALNEAGLLIKEGVPIERIDAAMTRFGMSFGPCEWMDRIGVDQVAGLAVALQPEFAGRITFESGFALMVQKQWLGNRTDVGFYRPGLRKKKVNGAAVDLWRLHSQGEVARPIAALAEKDLFALIQMRLVTLMVLEAFRCVKEGLANDADDLDCAMCLTGWATHRGGPLGFARQLGPDMLAARCAELMSGYGARFANVT